MDTQTWAGALKQVRGTFYRWPVLFSPLCLIPPLFPQPWRDLLALSIFGLAVHGATRDWIEARRKIAAKKLELKYRLELHALTLESFSVMHRYLTDVSANRPGAEEQARIELERIHAAQDAILEKWKVE